jgi:hypothetical protein
MKKLTEKDNFIHVFDAQAAKPDPVFRYQLKQQVLKEFEKKSTFSKFFSNLNGFQLGALSFTASSFLFAALIFTFISVYNNKNILEIGNNADNLSGQNKSAILNNIFNANPDSQIGADSLSNNKGFLKSDIPTSDVSNQNPQAALYNFRTLKQTNTLGTKSSVCTNIINLPLVTSMESYIASKDGDYSIKSVTYGSNNSLLNLYFEDKNKHIEYNGGSYAVTTAQAATSTATNKIDNSQLTEVQINGKQYYSLTRQENKAFCNDNDGIINVLTIDSDNYRIVSSKYYLNSIDDGNLIQESTFQYSESYEMWDKIKNTFDLSTFTLPIKNSSELKLEQVSDIKTNKDATISDITANTTQLHLLDRQYYPSGDKGNNLYLKTLFNSKFKIQYNININNLVISATFPSIEPQITAENTTTTNIVINGEKHTVLYILLDEEQLTYQLSFNIANTNYTFNYSGDLAQLPELTIK